MNFFIFLFVFIFWPINVLGEIRFVFEIFRHGARGPIIINKNNIDVFGELWTSQGELSPIGMRQHYLLGRRNYDKYKEILSPEYNEKEIYAISTDYNRTIMSAQSHLQGMYPPGRGPKLVDEKNKAIPPINYDFSQFQKELGDKALPYQMNVFPIHIFQNSNKMDNLFNSKICSKSGEIINPLSKLINILYINMEELETM